MRFSLLLITSLVTVATALPQRGGGAQGQFQDGRPSDQGAQGSGVQATDLLGFQHPQAGVQPPATPPGNAQAGLNQGAANEGNLNQGQGGLGGKGNGNVNQNGTITGNNGQSQHGQSQNGQNQNGQNPSGAVGNTGNQTGAFDASLVPEFGVKAGQGPDGKGNCIGLNNVKIPCSCPPDRQLFIQKVQAAVAAGNSEGVPVKFPLDNSSASKKARIQTSVVVLQNLNGKGVGCPAAATTFLAQQAAA